GPQIQGPQTQAMPRTARTNDDASTGIASATPPGELSAARPLSAATDSSPPAGMGAPDQDRIGDSHYTIERTGGQVRVTGPGVSIVSAAAGDAEADRRGASAHTSEPIICEG